MACLLSIRASILSTPGSEAYQEVTFAMGATTPKEEQCGKIPR